MQSLSPPRPPFEPTLIAILFASAVRQAKQRPLTDPLIVHVPDTAGALAVVDFGGEGGGGAKARRLLDLLGEKLWPGELLPVGALVVGEQGVGPQLGVFVALLASGRRHTADILRIVAYCSRVLSPTMLWWKCYLILGWTISHSLVRSHGDLTTYEAYAGLLAFLCSSFPRYFECRQSLKRWLLSTRYPPVTLTRRRRCRKHGC